MTSPSLSLGYVPGATPAKWARIWEQRHPEVALRLLSVAATQAADAVREGAVDVALLRPPPDTAGLALIALYDETTVAVVPTEHPLAAYETIAPADLEGEPVLLPLDDVVCWPQAPGEVLDHHPETTKDAIDLVAAGLGALIVPQSLARLYHRKDLTYRPIVDAPCCPVALAFAKGTSSELIEEFVGIVRGRKPGSSRGKTEPAPKRTAREKTLAKQAARAAAGKIARKPGGAGRGRR